MSDPHPIDGRERLALLIERELPSLRSYAQRLAGPDEAEDLVQDCLTRALRYAHALREDRSPGGWLRRTLETTWFERRRARQRERYEEREVHDIPVEQNDTLATRDELERHLARLAPVERTILLAFHGEGETLQEIAARLQLPVGTVKSHLHRARRKLVERSGEETRP